MKNLLMTMGIISAGLFIISGCDPDSRGANVSPKGMPDPVEISDYSDGNSQTPGYQDENNQYSDEGAGEFELLTVYFDYDDHRLSAESIEIMNENAMRMTENNNVVIKIEGHCDERGTEEYNLALGEKRARAVQEYLTNYGVAQNRVSIISYGESIPADMGQSESSWSKNRRAEFSETSR